MVYLDLIINLSLLVALTVVSGFIDRRWSRHTLIGSLLQGVLFGGVAVLGMLRPANLGPGLIFDGRSVMVSLCALFFGPWAAALSFFVTAACRIALGGAGTLTGVLVILSSAGIGLGAYFREKGRPESPSALDLYIFGLAVHLAMLALMFTLPGGAGLSVVSRIGLPVILLYPLATVLAGKILSDQASNTRNIEMLRESEERYRLLFDSSHDAILLTDPAGVIYAANPSACRLFGKSEEELKAGGQDGILDNTDPRLEAALAERARTGKFAGELTFLYKDGTKFPGEISTVLFQDRGHQVRTSTILRDITERKNTEKALRESEELFRNLFMHHTAIKLILDPDTWKIIDANEAAERFYGWSRERLMQMKISDINTLSPQELKFQLDKVKIRKKIRFEFCHRLADGSIREVEALTSKIEFKGKSFLHSIVNDITERKQAQKEIIRLNEELEQKVAGKARELHDSQLALLNLVDDLNESAYEIKLTNQSLEAVNKELAAFSYSVSHDLQAPLRSIDGFSNALLEDYADKLDEEGNSYLQRIRRATQNMSQLIDDLLNLSKVTKSDFYTQKFNLSDMVRNIADTEQHKTPLAGLVVDIQDDIIVRADQRLMNIVMTNLLNNAWKFAGKTKNPRIEFGAGVQDGRMVIFVRDNGVGFDMAYAEKIFTAFQRLHRAEEFPGTGIGLATVQRIINRHGGRIWVESEPGEGATFFFTLEE